MRWAELVLKYLEVVTWPGVAVGLVWFLREGVQDRLRAMTGLQAPGVSATFGSDRALERQIAEKGQVLGTDAPPTEHEGAPSADGSGASQSGAVEGVGNASVRLSASGIGEVVHRRSALEDLVQAAATWAADRQAAGLSTDIRVDWDEDGQPRLTVPPTMPRHRTTLRLREAMNAGARAKAERLERRVEELTREVKELQADPGVNQIKRRGAENELIELKGQLILMDPDSPYAG